MSSKTPLACDLTAIEENELRTHKENGESVFESVKGFRELKDGYALKLPADTNIIENAGGFVARERLCCPFFNFNLEVTSNHGPVWLKITGENRVKEFVELNIVSQFQNDPNNS